MGGMSPNPKKVVYTLEVMALASLKGGVKPHFLVLQDV